MKTATLISIGVFTILLVLTVYGWMDRIRGSNAAIKEGFEGDGPPISDETLKKVMELNEAKPSDDEATRAHRTLLLFIKNDFSKGVKFLEDINKRFYDGPSPRFRKDLNLSELTNNYSSPLQVV